MQKRTSKNTCQNFGTANRAYAFVPNETKTILDYGCGKYSNNENWCKEHNIVWYGYDPYWRDDSFNETNLAHFENNGVDCVICSNVLNVIDDDKEVIRILKYIKKHISNNTIVIFSCYRGDANNIGKSTKDDCWQRNEKPSIWYERISLYFDIIRKNADIFVCKKKSNKH